MHGVKKTHDHFGWCIRAIAYRKSENLLLVDMHCIAKKFSSSYRTEFIIQIRNSSKIMRNRWCWPLHVLELKKHGNIFCVVTICREMQTCPEENVTNCWKMNTSNNDAESSTHQYVLSRALLKIKIRNRFSRTCLQQEQSLKPLRTSI